MNRGKGPRDSKRKLQHNIEEPDISMHENQAHKRPCQSIEDILSSLSGNFNADFRNGVRQNMNNVNEVFKKSKKRRWKAKKKETIPVFLENYIKLQEMLAFFGECHQILHNTVSDDKGRLEAQLAGSQRTIEEKEKQLGNLQTLLEEKSKEASQMAQRQEEMKAHMRHYKDEAQKYQDDIVARDKQNSHLTDKAHKLKDQLREKDQLIQQINSRHEKEQKCLKDSENEILSLQEIIKTSETEYKYKSDESSRKIASLNQQLHQQYTSLNQQLHQQCNYNQQLEKNNSTLKVEVKERDMHIKQLSMKLAEEMSTKLSSDESSVENVSIKNRPMNVAEEYQMICSNTWLDAKGAIDEILGDDVPDYHKLQLLSSVIKTAEKEAIDVLVKTKNDLEDKLHSPIGIAMARQQIVHTDEEQLATKRKAIPTEFTNICGDILRNTSDSVDVEPLITCIDEKMSTMQYWECSRDAEKVKQYLSSVARLVWKMVIQRPPLKFRSSEEWKGDNFQDVFWNSKMVASPTVIEVYPMMYHGDSLMAKGKVLLLDPNKLNTS